LEIEVFTKEKEGFTKEKTEKLKQDAG